MAMHYSTERRLRVYLHYENMIRTGLAQLLIDFDFRYEVPFP